MGPTYPNRIYMHSAQSDRQENTMTISTVPTIWDRCAAAGVSHTYYFSDVPFTALWGSKYVSISQPYAKFLADCKTGNLPAVSFVDPRFEDEDSGTSGDDHPHGDIRVGERFLADVYEAITSSPAWRHTVFIVNFDEWGGFFDHVQPALVPDLNPINRRRGFRVPCLIISPFARRHYISSHTYDHTSVLKLIEWRWGLKPLTPRDAAARNIAEILNFASPNLAAPRWNVPRVGGTACQFAPLDRTIEWAPLKRMAVASGMRLAK
jgi:phospholipase C